MNRSVSEDNGEHLPPVLTQEALTRGLVYSEEELTFCMGTENPEMQLETVLSSNALARTMLQSHQWKMEKTQNGEPFLQLYLRYRFPSTVRQRKQQAELAAYELVDKLFSPQMTAAQTVRVAHDALAECCESDAVGQADSHTIYDCLCRHQAVCDGYAESFLLLMEMAGISCRFVQGRGKEAPHAWNLVEIEGKWYHVDAAWNDMGENDADRFFLRSDAAFASTHEWDH